MARSLPPAKVPIVAVDKTGRGIASAKKNLDGMGRSVKGIATALGGIAAAAGFAKLVSGTANALDQLGKLSKRTNVSVEALQSLKFASAQSGVEFSKVSNAFTLGAKNISEASEGIGMAKEEIAALGLNAAELAAMPIDQQFSTIVNRLADVENQTDKTRIATAIFGRTGAEVLKFGDGLPALQQEFSELGATVSGESVAAAEDFQDSLGRLKTVAFGVSSEFVANMLPTLTTAANFMAKNMPGAIDFAVTAFEKFRGVVQLTGAGLITLAIAFTEFKRNAFEIANFEAFQNFGEYAYTLLGAADFKAQIDRDLAELEALRDGFFQRAQGLFDPAGPSATGSAIESANAALSESASLFGAVDKSADSVKGTLNTISITAQRIPKFLTEWELVSLDVAQGMQLALEDYLFNPAERGIKGFAKSFLDTIRQIAARLASIKLLQAVFKGTPFAPFIPKFAEGGRPNTGQPAIVGERGPELFIPDRPGRIIPNHQMSGVGGGAPTFVTTFNVASGADPSFIQQLPAILEDHKRQTIAAVFEARQRRRAPA